MNESGDASYNQLINNLGYLDAASTLAEKRKVLNNLANFLQKEGYTQLGQAVGNKIQAIITKEYQ